MMGRAAENILEMARVDNGLVKMNFTTLNFSELVRDAALSFQLLYEERGMGLRCEVSEGITVSGSEQHLYQVLDVLLDNGLKYSERCGEVTVNLMITGRTCHRGSHCGGPQR